MGWGTPVLVDQEGGRVQRLGPPHWPAYPPAAVFGRLYDRDRDTGLAAVRLGARLIAADLAPLGIDVDCVPVLDIVIPGAHNVIGDRAFAADPVTVTALGRAQADGLLAGGVIPVVKHTPGHGRARADSHVELPVVETARAELEASDFVPFKALADLPWAMTAHVLYRALSTYSRGGFLSIGAVAGLWFWRSPHKLRTAAAVMVTAALVLPVLPQQFWDRAEEAAGHLVEITWSSATTLFEMSAREVTKASTLALFCAERDIDRSEVVAFGDMPNDLAMIGWAGTGYAMANAHPSLRDATPHVAPGNDEDGVAQVIEQLLDTGLPGRGD